MRPDEAANSICGVDSSAASCGPILVSRHRRPYAACDRVLFVVSIASYLSVTIRPIPVCVDACQRYDMDSVNTRVPLMDIRTTARTLAGSFPLLIVKKQNARSVFLTRCPSLIRRGSQMEACAPPVLRAE